MKTKEKEKSCEISIYFSKVFSVFRHFQQCALQQIDLFVDVPSPCKVWHDFVNRIYRQNVNILLPLMVSNADQYRLSVNIDLKKKIK